MKPIRLADAIELARARRALSSDERSDMFYSGEIQAHQHHADGEIVTPADEALAEIWPEHAMVLPPKLYWAWDEARRKVAELEDR